MNRVLVSGSFDDLSSRHVRFLQEAARFGEVHVLLWPDETACLFEGHEPKFPEAERLYFLQSLRWVGSVEIVSGLASPNALPSFAAIQGQGWACLVDEDAGERRDFCRQVGLEYHPIPETALAGFPLQPLCPAERTDRKKVIVTGSFDWLHSGHVRFFEEVSSYGDLIVVVGHDANIQLLKGAGHPLFRQDERLYMVQSIRYVSEALLSSGHGWLDAEPELERLKPDIYAVNEDGDKPEKREYCAQHGIQYLVLQRTPKEGLDSRSSTHLRGF